MNEQMLLKAIELINKVDKEIAAGYIGKYNCADKMNRKRLEGARTIIANVINDYRNKIEAQSRAIVRSLLMMEDYSILNREAQQRKLTRHLTLTQDIDAEHAAKIVTEEIEKEEAFYGK